MSAIKPVNMDFSKTVLMSAIDFEWVKSPAQGVTRCHFERENAEHGWACSLVRYAAHAKFMQHSHPNGEQFFVLEGCFSDHQGDFCVNTFVQNEAGSVHAPFSAKGCLIFVKLNALAANAKSMIVPIDSTQNYTHIKTSDDEFFEIIQLPKNTKIQLSACEVFILNGELEDNSKNLYPQYSWLRIAAQDVIELISTCASRYLISNPTHLRQPQPFKRESIC